MDYHVATITSKLQLALPKRLCEQRDIERGDKLAVTIERGAIIRTPMRSVIEGVAGSLEHDRSSD